MNIIRLLLIGGLVYFAMQQKKEGTRNMVLIVTGLLAVCMLSKEGFTIGSEHQEGTVTCVNSHDTGSCTDATHTDRDACEAEIICDPPQTDDGTVIQAFADASGASLTDSDACTALSGIPMCVNTWNATDCGAADGTGACAAGCEAQTGEITYALSEVFNNVNPVNTAITAGENVYEYTGADGLEITTLDGLRGAFTCNGEATTVKGTAQDSDIVGFNGVTKLEIQNLLECPASPPTPPAGSPPSGSPPSGSPPSGSPSSSSPSPPGTCIPGDGKTDKCGDDWEWVTAFFGSPNPSKLCYKNSFLWPNAYCK